MINTRLFEWYGIDTTKNLGIVNKCPKPFDTVLIDKQGSCYLCECTAWLPQSVGNLHLKSLEEIFHNDACEQIRDTIRDGTYRLCNEKQCTWIIKNDVRNHVGGADIRTIRLAIDDSCNLSCPSCRTGVIFHKKGKMFNMRMRLVDKINDYLKTHKNITVHIGSDGDPFASLIYRYFMRTVPKDSTIKFNLQTNGLLMKKMLERQTHIIDRIHTINISIDGATKETYERLRRGGHWGKLLENLEYISRYHKQFEIQFHMVVQNSNWQEMHLMLQLADTYNAHRVIFNKITNWNTYKDFHTHSVPIQDKTFLSLFNEIKKHPKSTTWQLV